MSEGWTSMKMPRKLYNEVKKIAEQEGLRPYQVVEKAVTMYIAQLEHTKATDSRLRYRDVKYYHPRSVYHAFKVLLAYADLRVMLRHQDKFAEEEIEKAMASFEYTLFRVTKDLKVLRREEIDMALKLIKEYRETKQGRILAQLNDLLREMFYRAVAVAGKR